MPPQTLDAVPAVLPVALPLEPIATEPELEYRPPPAIYTEPVLPEPVAEVAAEPNLDPPAETYDDGSGIAPHATDYHQSQAPTLRLMQRSLSAPAATEAITVPDTPEQDGPSEVALAPPVAESSPPGETAIPDIVAAPESVVAAPLQADPAPEIAATPAAQPVVAATPAIAKPVAGSNSLAITGLVLAFVFAPLGMIISVMALLKRKTKAAKIISTAGVTVSALGIVGILYFSLALAGSFSTVHGHNLDLKHQSNMEAVENQLQAAFIKNGSYPTLEQLNSSNWRATNLTGTTAEQLSPSIPPTALLGDQPTSSSYAYATVPAACKADKATPCTSFSLSAVLSTGQTYTIH